MLQKVTHKIPNAYRGSNNMIMTAGNGTPPADPSLLAIWSEGYAPEGLNFVSGYGIAVGINDKGYLQPCDGTVIPYGITAAPLISSAAFADPNGSSPVPTLTNGVLNQIENLHQITPTIFTNNALFQTGLAYNLGSTSVKGLTNPLVLDTTKVSVEDVKKLLDFKIGDVLRAATKKEVDVLVEANALLPVFIPSLTTQAQILLVDKTKLKAYYAGMMVRFNAVSKETSGVLTVTDAVKTGTGILDHNMKVARVAAFIDPDQFDNACYNQQYQFDYDVQGTNTEGLNREVWNIVGPVTKKGNGANTVAKILQYYITL